jgi:hypothetical protein
VPRDKPVVCVCAGRATLGASVQYP